MTDGLKNLILRHDRATPRYTSYPAAPHFQAGFGNDRYIQWLSDCADKRLSLYIHIPFCAKLCYYCGCHTQITSRADYIDDYLALLLREIELVAASLPGGGDVSHIHFGGGSPTMLSPGQFRRVMTHIRNHFTVGPKAEIAVEADPRTLTEGRIATYALTGVNRISFGVQDFDQDVLRAVNRAQPVYMTMDAVAWCRDYGIDRINFDLMYGLPGQTPETMRRTFDTALMLEPSRIAYFGYAHVPWVKKHMKMVEAFPLPDADQRYDLCALGSGMLTAADYTRIGIDHFVRPGDDMDQALQQRSLRRNFQGYTTDDAQALIGFGSSSIGALPQGFTQNSPDLRAYRQAIEAGNLPVTRGYQKTDTDRLHGEVIEQIMCYLSVDLNDVTTRHNLSPDYFRPALERLGPLVEDDLVSISDGTVAIRPDARQIVRLAAHAFDEHAAAAQSPVRHSRAV